MGNMDIHEDLLTRHRRLEGSSLAGKIAEGAGPSAILSVGNGCQHMYAQRLRQGLVELCALDLQLMRHVVGRIAGQLACGQIFQEVLNLA